MSISASVEAEIADLEAEDQSAFLEDMDLSDPALSRFIRTAYLVSDGDLMNVRFTF